jgi:hypothetical protein
LEEEEEAMEAEDKAIEVEESIGLISTLRDKV